jgi:hypothetical protein
VDAGRAGFVNVPPRLEPAKTLEPGEAGSMGRGTASPRRHWLFQSHQQDEGAEVRIERSMPVFAGSPQAHHGRTHSGGQLIPHSVVPSALIYHDRNSSWHLPSSGTGGTYGTEQALHAVLTPRREHAPPHSQQGEYGRPYPQLQPQRGHTPQDNSAPDWRAQQQHPPHYHQGGRTQSAFTPRGTGFPDYNQVHLPHGYPFRTHARNQQLARQLMMLNNSGTM